MAAFSGRIAMADGISTSDLRNTWNSAAKGWAKWEHVISAGLSEATDTLIDMADVGPGMRVLDLACGAGSQTLATAKRVGPGGSVVAVDISPSMLEYLRRNASRAGFQNIETLECAAEDLDETLTPFDASISRMGLMLFTSPSSALAAVQRVLKPGARFAAMVFTTPANNPFTAQPMAILLRHAGKSPPVPGQPGLFALGGQGVLAELMTGGGLTDVVTKTVRAPLRLPGASDAIEMMQQAFGAYRAVVAELSDAEKSSAWGEVHECLKQFESGRGFEAEAEFIIGSGAKPV
jgi:ubiquinone/menaquinone biosynthesis C-methylase UbiE